MKNKEFQKAATAAYIRALKDGLLIPPDRCGRCGRMGEVDGHHTDYAKPFHVEWLCRKCHNGTHNEFRSALRAAGLPATERHVPRTDVVCPHCVGRGWIAEPLPLTRKQADIYAYIWHYVNDRGYAPSFEDIAKRYGFASLATVHEHMQNLENKFWISRRYNEARAVVCLVDLSTEQAVKNVA